MAHRGQRKWDKVEKDSYGNGIKSRRIRIFAGCNLVPLLFWGHIQVQP